MNEPTPCKVLFQIMKRDYKVSYQELASLILSDEPMSDGKTALSKSGDRTWISRSIVNASASSLKTEMFSDYATAAIRIIARIKTREKNPCDSTEIYNILVTKGHPQMVKALQKLGQDRYLYQKVVLRLCETNSCTLNEKIEFAMTLFVATACSLDIRKAAEYTVNYAKTIHGSEMKTTPSIEVGSIGHQEKKEHSAPQIGILRVIDGYVKGKTHWVKPDTAGSTIGSIALGENDITDVATNVSSRHARIFKESTTWYIEDLESRNGTVHINGSTGEMTQLDRRSSRITLHAGDEILLAKSTRFVIIEGFEDKC